MNKCTKLEAMKGAGAAEEASTSLLPRRAQWRRVSSPLLLERPEKTDFIGCLPFWSLRCQQQKKMMVAMVPSRSNKRKRAHWML